MKNKIEIFEQAILYKKTKNQEALLNVKNLMSDYLYALIRKYANKNTNINLIFKKTFDLVKNIIENKEYKDSDSLMYLFKIHLSSFIMFEIVQENEW